MPPADEPRPLWDHIAELRARLIVSAAAVGVAGAAALAASEPLVGWLRWPLAEAQARTGIPAELIATSPIEIFVVAFKVAILVGLGAAFPVVLYEAFRFVDPGLRGVERRVLYPFFGAGVLLFYAGVWLAYRFLMPGVFAILLRSQTQFGVAPYWTVEKYFSTEVGLLFACGLLFEVPVVMAALGRLGILSPEAFRGKWRVVIFASAALAAWITPTGDPVTMLVVAGLLVGFLAVGWLVLRFTARPRRGAGPS